MDGVLLCVSASGEIVQAGRGAGLISGDMAAELTGEPVAVALPGVSWAERIDARSDRCKWEALGRVEPAWGGDFEARCLMFSSCDGLIELLPGGSEGNGGNSVHGSPAGGPFLANLLEDTRDAIVGLDPKQRMTLWNRGAEALFGWKAEEMLGQHVSVLVPEEHRREIDELQGRVEQEGHVSDFPAIRRRQEGKALRVRITRTALHDKRGRLIGSSAIMRDETAHVEARRVDPDQDVVPVCIADTGPGIDPANLPHVFNPFFTSKRGIGTGLDLAARDQLITGHGGSITAASQMGQGTTFTIARPVRQRRAVGTARTSAGE